MVLGQTGLWQDVLHFSFPYVESLEWRGGKRELAGYHLWPICVTFFFLLITLMLFCCSMRSHFSIPFLVFCHFCFCLGTA